MVICSVINHDRTCSPLLSDVRCYCGISCLIFNTTSCLGISSFHSHFMTGFVSFLCRVSLLPIWWICPPSQEDFHVLCCLLSAPCVCRIHFHVPRRSLQCKLPFLNTGTAALGCIHYIIPSHSFPPSLPGVTYRPSMFFWVCFCSHVKDHVVVWTIVGQVLLGQIDFSPRTFQRPLFCSLILSAPASLF